MKKKQLFGKSAFSRVLGMGLGLAMVFTSTPFTSYAAAGMQNTAAYAPEEDEVSIDDVISEKDDISESGETGINDENGLSDENSGNEEIVLNDENSEDEPAIGSAGEEEAVGEGESSMERVEINQGLSLHPGLNDGQESYINDFVAKKQTVIMIKIPGSDSMTEDQAKEAVKNYKMEARAVTNGQEADNAELSANGDNFSVKRAYTKFCELDGWYATASFANGPDKGTYNFHIKDGDKEIAQNLGVNFYETVPLNILVVPVNTYYSARYTGGAPEGKKAYNCSMNYYAADGSEKPWSSLLGDLKSYLLDTYPIAEVNFEEAKELDCSDPKYDVVAQGDGQKNLWDEVCKLQTKNKEGKDRYDLILAFVPYRQDQGGGQGFTFGKPANIITYTDKDMFPTVAHEIAHCYQVGDEYDGGSLNNDVNYAPNGYKGRNYVTGAEITSNSGAHEYWMTPKEFNARGNGSMKGKADENGLGTMIYLNLHPYSLSQEKFICWAGVDPATGKAAGSEVYPTISWMGSGFTGCDGYYWTTGPIWDQLFKSFVKKEKKEAAGGETSEETVTNVDVFRNSLSAAEEGDYTLFADEDDFYYDDDCRWGDSRMVEVDGWLDRAGNGSVTVNDMAPLFSYDGDLEFIEVLDDVYKSDANKKNVYTFAALDKDGRIITSPVDGQPAAVEFWGSFYNPSNGDLKDPIPKEKHFHFDAEYPEGTADFAIANGTIEDVVKASEPKYLWKMSADAYFEGTDFEKTPEGYLLYADVNSEYAEVEWEVAYDDESENAKDLLYTEIYYCPEGDDGQAYYVACSDDEDWEEGYICFNTDGDFDTKWTRNAYVWIKVTNRVNACDIYSDSNEVTLCYSEIALSGAGIKASKDGDQTVYTAECTGKAIEPKTTVKAYNPETGKYISLKKDVDYSVSYQDNVEVGFATVTVQGIGLYAGKNTREFEITPKDIAGFVPEEIPNLTYSSNMNSVVMPYLNMKDSSNNQLVNGRDFSVKFNDKDNLDDLFAEAPNSPTTVTACYYGKGNYAGYTRKSVTFDVVPAKENPVCLSQDNTTITLKAESAQYTGKAVKPKVKSVVVKDAEGNEVTLKTSDYKVVYSNNVGIGTARVTIVGKKSYTGSAYRTFEIAPKKVKSLSVSGIRDQAYTGSEIKLEDMPIVVKAGGVVLTRGIDYTIEKGTGDFTKVSDKSSRPQVVIRLITVEEAQAANRKVSEYPRVAWADNVKDAKKTVTRSFSIVKVKLKSTAVSLVPKSAKTSENEVKLEGKVVGTVKNAPRADLKKYALIIEGEADELAKGADLSNAVVLKAFGAEVKEGYTITVSKAKDGKIGTIIIKADKDGSLSGTKKVKFLYQKAAAEGEEEAE